MELVFGTQPLVLIQDAFGNTVISDSTSSVTLAITSGTGTSGAALTCTPATAINGVASFAGCKIDKAGTGYTLTATSGSLTSATSNPFNITVGPASKLAFTTSPSNSTGGVAFGIQPVVTVQDAGGNTVISDSTSSVTLAITSGTGTSGAALSCAPATAVNGVASFSGCKIDKAGMGYTLTATSGSLASATSSSFNITVGSASKLAFTTSPSNSAVGQVFPTQPVVAVQDAGGNTITTDTRTITLTISSGTGTAGATLSCTALSKSAVAGVAAFAGCKIGTVGTGYTLTATGGALQATSNSFNISAVPVITSPSTSSPATVAKGSVGANLSFTGSGFQAGATVTLTTSDTGFALNSYTVSSPTQFTVNVNVPSGNNKVATITITNPDGGTVSCSNCIKTSNLASPWLARGLADVATAGTTQTSQPHRVGRRCATALMIRAAVTETPSAGRASAGAT